MPFLKGTPQSKEHRDKRAEAMRRSWAQRPQEAREKCLRNLRNDKEHLARAREAAVEARIGHLTADQKDQYRDLRRKQFSSKDALSLVETGKLP